jgi:hypothetical protein
VRRRIGRIRQSRQILRIHDERQRGLGNEAVDRAVRMTVGVKHEANCTHSLRHSCDGVCRKPSAEILDQREGLSPYTAFVDRQMPEGQ